MRRAAGGLCTASIMLALAAWVAGCASDPTGIGGGGGFAPLPDTPTEASDFGATPDGAGVADVRAPDGRNGDGGSAPGDAPAGGVDVGGDATPLEDGAADAAVDAGPCTGFGCPCSTGADCDSALCAEGPDGLACTQSCVDTCPEEGFVCRSTSTFGEPITACLALHPRLCRPCRTDDDCNAGNEAAPALCVTGADPDQGRFCGASCAGGVPCPSGFACAVVDTAGGGQSSQCVPLDGQCDCRAAWAELGLTTDCVLRNEFGACPGVRSCGPVGLGSCEARLPSNERCNGADDDCDGTTDNVAPTPCDLTNTFGTCPGTRACTPAGEEMCVGSAPAAEACDGVDNDCDGETDEGSCDDGDDCTVDTCREDGTCAHAVAPATCIIDGACVPAGRSHLTDPCLRCDPDNDPRGWTVADGEACDDGDACTHGDRCAEGRCGGTAYSCNDGLDCTNDVCDGQGGCGTEVVSGFCLIDGACHADGALAAEGSCLACDAAAKPRAWSDRDGQACSDGDPCTHSDRCALQTCVGTAYVCNDDNPCTVDTCRGDGGCDHAQASTACTIDGACYADGAVHPADPCRACNPAASTTAWSPRSGPVCDDGDACTSGDRCENGTCTGNRYSCDDSLNCTDDLCDGLGGCNNPLRAGRCLIADACFSDGANNPANECQRCRSHAPRTWTDADGASCSDDNPCTDDDRCTAGACAGTPQLDTHDAAARNDTIDTATDLGEISDGEGPGYRTFTATLYGPGDEDWYTVWYKDDTNGDAGPRPEAELLNIPPGTNYDLCIWWEERDGGRPEVDCGDGSKERHASGIRGCCSRRAGTAAEKANVDPGNLGLRDDAGRAWFQVIWRSGPWTCQPYSLKWGDD